MIIHLVHEAVPAPIGKILRVLVVDLAQGLGMEGILPVLGVAREPERTRWQITSRVTPTVPRPMVEVTAGAMAVAGTGNC